MTASPSGTIHAKRVSIILPVYNGARYLRQAIESCLTQTYQNFELIVVDDGSQDNSVEIVKTYTDSRLTLIQHDRNKKLPAALNTGFSHSIGSYLTWTSHDNYYVPTAIAELVQFLEDSRGVDFVYSDEYIIDERDGSVQLDRTGPVERLVEQSCLGGCFLYTRAVYEQLGPYDERLFLAEDYDYWLRALSSFKLAHLDRALYYYRLHPRSLTVLYTADGVELALRIRRRHLTHHPVRYRRPLSRAHASASRLLLDAHRRRAATRAALWSVLFDPTIVGRHDFKILLAELGLGARGMQLLRHFKKLVGGRPSPSAPPPLP